PPNREVERPPISVRLAPAAHPRDAPARPPGTAASPPAPAAAVPRLPPPRPAPAAPAPAPPAPAPRPAAPRPRGAGPPPRPRARRVGVTRPARATPRGRGTRHAQAVPISALGAAVAERRVRRRTAGRGLRDPPAASGKGGAWVRARSAHAPQSPADRARAE